MKYFLVAAAVLLGFLPVYAAETMVSQVSPTRIYLPGDVIHLVVAAPVDTVDLLAQMPDGSRIPLGFERRSHIWHGYWEVPYSFKKGDYHAKLIATDVEGKIFEGQTKDFYIGEPSLVTMIGKTTGEVARPQPPEQPTVSRPARVTKEISRPVAARKPKVKAKAKPELSFKFKKIAAKPLKVERPKGKKAELLAALRYYLGRSDYQKARQKIEALIEADPGNAGYKKMRQRLQVLIAP